MALLLLLGIWLCGSFQARIKGTPMVEREDSLLRLNSDTDTLSGSASVDPCHDTEQGDACHKSIVWAKGIGIREHPEWYSGLTAGSDVQSFQLQLYRTGHGNCSKPCGTSCEDALPDSKCGIAVAWAKKHGI